MRTRLLTTVLVVVFVASFTGVAAAQTTDEINAGIQFDFSLPGARSLGMGGAFVALSDDATAAYSNPAGLIVLRRPEVTVEGRIWNYTSILPVRGHAFGPPSGVGIDTIAGIVNGELEDTETAPAFVSLVYPLPSGKWAFAVYRHQLSKYQARVRSEGPFASDEFGAIARVNPLFGELDLDIANFGASVAYQVNPELSIGVGVGYFNFNISSRTDRFLLLPHLGPGERIDLSDLSQTQPGGQLGPADFARTNALFFNTADGDDNSFAVTAGIKWAPSDKWSVGGAFRQGPDFDFSTTFQFGPAGVRTFGTPPEQVLVDVDDVIFHVPDSYAAGIAFRPDDRWKFAAEYNFVQYTQLLDGSGEGHPVEIAGLIERITPEPDPDLRAELQRQGQNIIDGLTIDNAHQIRVGAEWNPVVTRQWQVYLRGGTWFDPDHRVRFEGEREIPGSALDVRLDDEFHYSGGVGLVYSSYFAIDAAIDISERINTISLSSVFFLGGGS